MAKNMIAVCPKCGLNVNAIDCMQSSGKSSMNINNSYDLVGGAYNCPYCSYSGMPKIIPKNNNQKIDEIKKKFENRMNKANQKYSGARFAGVVLIILSALFFIFSSITGIKLLIVVACNFAIIGIAFLLYAALMRRSTNAKK